MSAHTPGPWVVQDESGQGWSDDGCRRVQMRAGSPFVKVYPDPDRVGSVDANAALISAAPELLEALERVLGIAEALAKEPAKWRDLADARAAIAKARGGR